MDMTNHSKPPIRPAGIDHIVLRCARLQETLHFYETVLGCHLHRVDDTHQLYQLRAGPDALIDLVPVGSTLGGNQPPHPKRPNMAHFCLRIAAPDWATVAKHLQQQGLDWQEPRSRYGAQGRGPSVYVTDPEGNQVELKAEQE